MTYSIHLTNDDLNNKEKMDAFQELMNAGMDETVKEIERVAEELKVNDSFASAIVYLRTRSRWTQELENKLVEMAKAGESCPNMMGWP